MISISCDYKIRDGVSKKHLALKLLKKKGFDSSIIADAEYLYDKLQKVSLQKTDSVVVDVVDVDAVDAVDADALVVVDEKADEKNI